MVRIKEVDRRSLAERAGLLKDDILISINDNEINDVLDYRFYLAERSVKLTFKRDGALLTAKIKKGQYDDIGLCFETPLMDKKHSCKNGCVFCFIDQNPDGLRDSLYFKDDDSRLSFIHGNYITLTNLTDADVARIVKMRFSPINISIHTTNPDLRVKMMKNKHAGDVLRYLSVFKDAGLSMCGQIVLCKGLNDGEELLRSMRELSQYFPNLTSVSIVPAGLTKHREGLYPLADFTPDEAADIIDAVNSFGDNFNDKNGSRLFFVADEFYLKSGRELPSADYYEDYPQIENGVGMIRSFVEEANMGIEDAELDGFPCKTREISLVTGTASYPFISAICAEICKKCSNLKINVYKIINNFFGESITVSGLLTGADIREQLADKPLGECLYIPANALRKEECDFLCGMSLSSLSEELSIPVIPLDSDGYEFVNAMLNAESQDGVRR